MGDIEATEKTNSDILLLIRQARASAHGLNARVALDIVADKLENSPGDYLWASLGEGKDRVWQCRIPRHNGEAAVTEEALLLHICNPLRFLEAAEGLDKQGSAAYCGYVSDSESKYRDDTTMACKRCNRPMPSLLARAGMVQIKLHKLGMGR